MIYIVGKWKEFGPRANDCDFLAYFVTKNKATANERAVRDNHVDIQVMECEEGSDFHEWNQLTKPT